MEKDVINQRLVLRKWGQRLESLTPIQPRLEREMDEMQDGMLSAAEQHEAALKARRAARNKAYYEANKSRHRASMASWYSRNRDRALAAQKAYAHANEEDVRRKRNERYQRDKKRIAVHQAAKYLREREERRLKAAAYYQANREKIRARQAAQKRSQPKSEREILTNRIRSAICQTLKKRGSQKAGRSWTSLVGYTVEEMVAHLKRTLPAGWTWQDYLDGKMHLDHIIPIKVFNFRSSDDHDFKRCWALKNLRLLPEAENRHKSAKLLAPFQPSLL